MDAAAASLQDLCEESTCSICLEYFQDPVTIDCGHNFCRACLAKCWESSLGEEVSCPQCRGKVRRNLIPNRSLANFVDLTKKLHLQEEKSPGGKGGVCEKHQEPLKLFCKDDEAPICVVCDRAKEHRNHDVVPLEEAAQDYQGLICSRLQLMETVRANILAYKAETEEKSQKLLKQTKTEMEKMKEQFKELHSLLNEGEKLLLAQLEEVDKEIEKERDEHLAKLSWELRCLGGLIWEMEEMCQQSPVELLQGVRSILQRFERKKTFQYLITFPSELNVKISEVSDRNNFLVGLIKQLKDSLVTGSQTFKGAKAQTKNPMTLPRKKKANETRSVSSSTSEKLGGKKQQHLITLPGRLSRYLQPKEANVTLDPETAYPFLVLSEDCKSVNCGDKFQDLPKSPKRFDHWSFVLGREGFTKGRHYWEVTVGSEGDWAVGVARKSVRRKGIFELSTEEGIWAIRKCVMERERIEYRATNHSDQSVLPLSGNLRKIRVSLNFLRFSLIGKVAFHDGVTGSHLYTFSRIPFFEEPFPFFYVAGRASLNLLPEQDLISL